MIKQITDINQIQYEKLSKNHYGRRFCSLLNAYGLDYDFCRFYEILYKDKKAYFVVLNSSITICSNDEINTEELADFINLHEICTVELPIFLADKIKLLNYKSIERIFFEFKKGNYPKDIFINENPNLNDVFEILKTGFPLEDCYELWLTDTSHRIRHGESKIFLYNNTTATMYYNIDKTAFFGQVATAPKARGKGYARELLYWLYEKMSENDIKAQIAAKPERVSFYKNIGFKEIDKDIIFEINKE